MSKSNIIACLLVVAGILVLVHQWTVKGVLIEASDIDCHEFIAGILLSAGIGGLLLCRK